MGCCGTGADNHDDEDGPGPRACRYGGGAWRIIHYHHDHVHPFRLQCRVLQLGCWMVGTQKGMVLCSWRPWVQVKKTTAMLLTELFWRVQEPRAADIHTWISKFDTIPQYKGTAFIAFSDASVTTDGVHFSSQVFPRCCPWIAMYERVTLQFSAWGVTWTVRGQPRFRAGHRAPR